LIGLLGDEKMEEDNEVLKQITDLKTLIYKYIRLSEETGLPLDVDEAVMKLEEFIIILNDLKNVMTQQK